MLDMLKRPDLLDLDDIAINGGTQPRAALNQDTITEYAEALREGANFPPVIVYYDGKDHWLADGFHRYHAHRRAELTEINAEIRQGTRRDAVLYSVGANADHGIRRTNEDKRRAVMVLLRDEEWSQWSNYEIARCAKCSEAYVRKIKKDEGFDTTHSAQYTHPKTGTVATMNTANIGASRQQPERAAAKVEDRTPQQLIEEKLKEWGKEPRTPQQATAPAPPAPSPMAVHFSSDTPEHYTPAIVVAAVLKCLGSIELDPCSNSHQSPNIPADVHYTIEDNGLRQRWAGNVYMNPPYGREIGEWVQKLVDNYETGAVSAAIALVPARTDTQWWQTLRDYPVCLVSGRLKFGNAENSAPFPSAIFYLGNDIDRFYHAFSSLGDIWQRIEPGMFGE